MNSNGIDLNIYAIGVLNDQQLILITNNFQVYDVHIDVLNNLSNDLNLYNDPINIKDKYPLLFSNGLFQSFGHITSNAFLMNDSLWMPTSFAYMEKPFIIKYNLKTQNITKLSLRIDLSEYIFISITTGNPYLLRNSINGNVYLSRIDFLTGNIKFETQLCYSGNGKNLMLSTSCSIPFKLPVLKSFIARNKLYLLNPINVYIVSIKLLNKLNQPFQYHQKVLNNFILCDDNLKLDCNLISIINLIQF